MGSGSRYEALLVIQFLKQYACVCVCVCVCVCTRAHTCTLVWVATTDVSSISAVVCK